MFIITLNLNKAIESANTNVVFLNQAIIKGNHINIIQPKYENSGRVRVTMTMVKFDHRHDDYVI